MNRNDFSAHRVLLVGGKTHSMGLVRSILGIIGITRIVQVQETARALELLATESFTAVFASPEVEEFDGQNFVIAARRRHGMLNPMIPLYLLQERAHRRDVEAARDYGVTDILTVPLSPKTVMAKLKTAETAPRPFIASAEFFGPDRRSKARAAWDGSDRRKRAAKKTKVDFTHI